MGLSKSSIAATFSVAMLACAIPVTTPAFGADNKQTNQSGGEEARGCQDLREGMTALTRSRKELSEAAERVQGDANKAAIQGILKRTEESMRQTNSIMDKLQCAKS